MKSSFWKTAFLLTVSLPLLAGCVVYERQPVAVEPAAPPVPVEVVPVAPGPLAVWFWAPGNWEWRERWVWVPGRWALRPHPGAVWIGGGWVRHGHSRVWVESHWR
jgi:hypothetical protein